MCTVDEEFPDDVIAFPRVYILFMRARARVCVCVRRRHICASDYICSPYCIMHFPEIARVVPLSLSRVYRYYYIIVVIASCVSICCHCFHQDR